MFAPAAPLARAVDKAKRHYRATQRQVRDEVDVAQRLYHDAIESPEERHRDGEPVPEEMNADEAGEVLEDEYRPLMSDELQQRRRKGGQRGDESDSHDDEEEDDDEEQGGHAWTYRNGDGPATKARKLEVWLAQGIFFILGAAILLSWNTEIVAGSYFGERLKDSPFERSFANFVALTFTTANLLFLAWANATQAKADLNRRILWSLFVLIAILCIFVGSTRFVEINATLFFSFLIVSAILLGASASYLQNAVVALSASFGPVYLNQILSGQGAIGFVVAMIQFVAAYGAVKAAQPDKSHFDGFRLQLRGDEAVYATAADAAKEVRQTAFAFFLTVLGVAIASLVSYIVLVKLPLYRLVFRAEFDPSAGHSANDASKHKSGESVVRRTERKVRHLGIAIFLVFCVTLAVFPSITATIVSVRTGSPDAKLLQQPALFVPLGFAVFAGGDWLGRVLPQWEFFQWTNWKILMACSVARVVFIPLFLICNQAAGGTGMTIIRSDIAFFAIMLAFAVSNGYLSTLIMLASLVEPSLEEDEIEVAATCLAFYLTLGLSVGSLLSFGVRGAICRCNPFL
ncbi:hypothetical protein JCM10908_006882 [Rhodotorula pacifica]|uniref:nucleoside transmembrane transporter FUN26 n=1 Tax=Rhodotorula pacifica TaxID=1495444 RepID=UPI003178ED09